MDPPALPALYIQYKILRHASLPDNRGVRHPRVKSPSRQPARAIGLCGAVQPAGKRTAAQARSTFPHPPDAAQATRGEIYGRDVCRLLVFRTQFVFVERDAALARYGCTAHGTQPPDRSYPAPNPSPHPISSHLISSLSPLHLPLHPSRHTYVVQPHTP